MGRQSDRDTAPVQASGKVIAGSVPWAVHELAMVEYHRRHGFGQSTEMMAQRAGLSWAELIACLRSEYTSEGVDRAVNDLAAAVAGPHA